MLGRIETRTRDRIYCRSNQIKSNQFYLYTAIFENDSGVFTVQKINRECAFGLSGRGRGGSRLPGTHSTQFIGHEVMRLSTYYCAMEAYCAIV